MQLDDSTKTAGHLSHPSSATVSMLHKNGTHHTLIQQYLTVAIPKFIFFTITIACDTKHKI